ncbi:MAG: DUF1837 domain-containing protein [Planctomycetes bacterium]|nr:DUF1837 domain-containing protein [Planctomycetota bacterium]
MPDIDLGSLATLAGYLSVAKQRYDACFARLPDVEVISAPAAQLEYHYLKFDPVGNPKVRDLVDSLVDHLAAYCFRAQRLPKTLDSVEWGKTHRQASQLLRKWVTSGEPGEIVLFLLIEALLGATQIIAKAELKLNPGVEQHGSDGVHARWIKETNSLELILGESKLEQSPASAAQHAAESILKYHDKHLLRHELQLLSSHFKWADEELKRELLSRMDPVEGSGEYTLVHACLLGYDWPGYDNSKGPDAAQMVEKLTKEYGDTLTRLRKNFDTHFEGLSKIPLRLVVFHLPFPSVQAFRTQMLSAIGDTAEQ